MIQRKYKCNKRWSKRNGRLHQNTKAPNQLAGWPLPNINVSSAKSFAIHRLNHYVKNKKNCRKLLNDYANAHLMFEIYTHVRTHTLTCAAQTNWSRHNIYIIYYRYIPPCTSCSSCMLDLSTVFIVIITLKSICWNDKREKIGAG